MKPTDKTQKKSEIESAASGELKKQINEIDEKIDSTEKKDIQHQIDDIESQIKKEEQKNKNLNKEYLKEDRPARRRSRKQPYSIKFKDGQTLDK